MVGLPLSPGRAESHEFEYYRHGTLSLYAALETRTGEVLGKTAARHTSAEFVGFLDEVVASQPSGKEIHVIIDKLSAHKTKMVDAFLADHPNVRLHYTPTYSSWLNQVENLFSKIQRHVIARGVLAPSPICAGSSCVTSGITTKPPLQSDGLTPIPNTESNRSSFMCYVALVRPASRSGPALPGMRCQNFRRIGNFSNVLQLPTRRKNNGTWERIGRQGYHTGE